MDSAQISWSLMDIKMSITAFASSCTRPSADFFCVPVALRSESVCRVEALARPGVALARLVLLCGVWRHVRCTGALHVLSICYELSGNNVVHSAELMAQPVEMRGYILAKRNQCAVTLYDVLSWCVATTRCESSLRLCVRAHEEEGNLSRKQLVFPIWWNGNTKIQILRESPYTTRTIMLTTSVRHAEK